MRAFLERASLSFAGGKMNSLRSKLSKRKKPLKAQEATQVIYLDTLLDDFNASENTAANNQPLKVSWFDKYQISEIKKADVLLHYKMTLHVLMESLQKDPTLPVRVHLKKALLSLYGMNGTISAGITRKTRKEIFRRLSSLLQGAEAFFEILNDQSITRVVVSDRLTVRQYKNDGGLQNIVFFYCEEENRAFRACLNHIVEERGDYGVMVFEGQVKNLIVEQLLLHDQSSHLVIKQVSKTNGGMLELIRAKMFNPLLSRGLSKIVKERAAGVIVSGAPNTGKSRMISGLLSALPLQRVPLVIGNVTRLKVSHANATTISEHTLMSYVRDQREEEFISSMSKMGLTDVFIDDATPEMIPLLFRFSDQCGVYPIISLRGDAHRVIESIAKKNETLDYLCKFAPLIIDLGGVSDESSLKAIYEVQKINASPTLVCITEKVSNDLVWNLTGVSCESARFFDTLKVTD